MPSLFVGGLEGLRQTSTLKVLANCSVGFVAIHPFPNVSESAWSVAIKIEPKVKLDMEAQD